MRDVDEILASGKISCVRHGSDGFSGWLSMGNFDGSVICSWGAGWDHVSISPRKRSYTPSWSDMCRIKELFFLDSEAVIQIHPPKAEYVNNMPNCLHLWRANDAEMVLPPAFMVGIRQGQTLEEVEQEIMTYYKEHGYKWGNES